MPPSFPFVEVYSAVHSLAKRHIVTLWEEELPVLNNYIRRFVDRAGAFPSLPLTCSRDALLQFCESEAGAVSNLSSTVESIAAKAGSASSGYESDASDTTVHGRFRKFHHLPASEEHMVDAVHETHAGNSLTHFVVSRDRLVSGCGFCAFDTALVASCVETIKTPGTVLLESLSGQSVCKIATLP